MTKSEVIAQLLERYGRPPKLRLARVLDLIAGISDPEIAWDAVLQSNVLPSDFAQNTNRKFASEATEGRLSSQGSSLNLSYPPSIEAIQVIASNPEGVVAAESFAQKHAVHLAPWMAVCDNSVVWNFNNHRIDCSSYLSAAYNNAIDTIDYSLERHGIELQSLEPDQAMFPLPLVVRKCVSAWEGWQIATAHLFAIDGPKWPLDLSRWHAFSAIPNPFEHLIKVWTEGYLLYSHFTESDPSIRLFAQLQ